MLSRIWYLINYSKVWAQLCNVCNMVEKEPQHKFESEEQLRDQIAYEMLHDLKSIFLNYPYLIDNRLVILATEPWDYFVMKTTFEPNLKEFLRKQRIATYSPITDDQLYGILKDIRSKIVDLANAKLSRYIDQGSWAVIGSFEEQLRADLVSRIINSFNKFLKKVSSN